MSPMQLLLIIWGAVTLMFIVLMIYRSTLVMHEDDQLFLSDADSHMQREQTELQHRMDKLQPLVRLLGAASGMLLVAMAGIWIWRAYQQF